MYLTVLFLKQVPCRRNQHSCPVYYFLGLDAHRQSPPNRFRDEQILSEIVMTSSNADLHPTDAMIGQQRASQNFLIVRATQVLQHCSSTLMVNNPRLVFCSASALLAPRVKTTFLLTLKFSFPLITSPDHFHPK